MKIAVSIPDELFHRADRLARRTGLPKDSVANVSHIVAVDRGVLSEHVAQLGEAELDLVRVGIDLVLGRE